VFLTSKCSPLPRLQQRERTNEYYFDVQPEICCHLDATQAGKLLSVSYTHSYMR